MKRALPVILLLALAAALPTIPVVFAQPEEPHNADAMWVEPGIIDVTDLPVGYKFNVTVWINLTQECAGWQFYMIYNNATLNATRCGYTAGDKSDFFKNITTLPLSPTFASENDTHNYVLHGESWLMGDFRSPGYGSLSWVEFQIIAEPPEGQEITTTLDISTYHHPPTSKTYALNPQQEEIPLNVYDCTYTFKSPTPTPPPEAARIFVDPNEIIDPTMLPSSTFHINITIDDVIDVSVCELNLTYNSVVISWTGMIVLKVQNQTPSVKSMIDNEAGFVWVKLQYPTSFSTDTPTPLLKIDFHVNSLGATPLDLHDTELLNSEGQPIEHEAIDGFFCTLIRDVAVTNVNTSREWVYQGWNVNITVTVRNKGNMSETFHVQAYYDAYLIGNLTVTDLPPNNETTITFVWNTENVTPCTNYTISAEASQVPYELNTADNRLTDGKIKIRYMGDVNGDDFVDIKDIYAAAEAYGSYPSSPLWNPDCDLDQNLIIDIKDIFTIATNFGKCI